MGKDERTIALLGLDNFEKIKSKKVIIFGVGGVGGYVTEMLARTGVETLTLVDFDTVSESNINRQIIANLSSVGKLKVECFKERILNINPNCNIKIFAEKLTGENISVFDLKSYDYVIDCIDDVNAKISLIEFCNQNGIKIISSMGAGNRYQVPKFEICDISKTKNDGLARAIRYRLRKIGINHLTVCYTEQDAKKQNVVGSIAYFPAMAGITIASFVINKFLEE